MSSPQQQGALRVCLADYPYTLPLKDGTVAIPGAEVEFVEVSPIHHAFGPMVAELAYDVSELAIATYVQAKAAGVPIRALPVTLHANNHHLSLNRLADGPETGPQDLVGQRVAVRSYSQTTGLWVKGILNEEFTVASSDATWVTTEAGHVPGYVEPANVERAADGVTVMSMLKDRTVVAGVVGARSASKPDSGLVPVIPDAQAAGLRWMERHGTAAVNHLLVVREDCWQARAAEVTALVQELAELIKQTRDQRPDNLVGDSITAGWSPTMRAGLELAARYAYEQQLVRTPVDLDAIAAEMSVLAV